MLPQARSPFRPRTEPLRFTVSDDGSDYDPPPACYSSTVQAVPGRPTVPRLADPACMIMHALVIRAGAVFPREFRCVIGWG